MQFSTVLITFLASLAAASLFQESQFGLYSSAHDTAQCCNVSVGGIANPNRDSPSPIPASIDDFKKVYAASGQAAYCCTISLAGDALLCTSPEARLSRYKVEVEVTTQKIRFAEVKFKLQLIRLKAMQNQKERAYNVLVTI
ncbi:hypothetical protein F5882DRAFT_375945 [Hyaloscypha sp. PMI_1271]|nr:hypothetical protein F5882DRAFT_375945 [Hyaloscypha sp. PMI_1271]